MLFHPKLLWVYGRGRGWGVGGRVCSFVGHRAKKWRTVGQNVTYNGPKCDVRGAEKWRTGQNATLECCNLLFIIHDVVRIIAHCILRGFFITLNRCHRRTAKMIPTVQIVPNMLIQNLSIRHGTTKIFHLFLKIYPEMKSNMITKLLSFCYFYTFTHGGDGGWRIW